jgi:hypothetical protein
MVRRYQRLTFVDVRARERLAITIDRSRSVGRVIEVLGHPMACSGPLGRPGGS